jgi:hypothetical protein
MTFDNSLLKWMFLFLIILLPIINFNMGDVRVSYESYKFSFVALLLLMSINISVNRTLLQIYLFIVFSVILIAIDSIYNIYTNSSLEQDVALYAVHHIITQVILYLLFTSLIVAVVSTKIKNSIFGFAFKTYIVSLVFISILSIFLLVLEINGVELIGSSYGLGTYKLQGILGEPKQFSAAIMSGILLLNMPRVNRMRFFSKHTKNILSVLFLVSGLASFSSSFVGSLILIALFYAISKLISIKKTIIIALILVGIIIPQLIDLNNCQSTDNFYERKSIGHDEYTVFRKISSFGSIVSFLPKDGAVIVDAVCRPQHYIFGGGPGSLYTEFITAKMSNYESLLNISIFRDMNDNPLSVTQGPSTFQVRLFSDYGVVGVILIFLLLMKSERILLNGSKNNYYSIYPFFIFIMSIQYFMFLILMYFFALKAIQISKYNKNEPNAKNSTATFYRNNNCLGS